MREHIFRMHHQLFMNAESVSECMFLKAVQSRRSCTLILKMARCNARTHVSHPLPAFYEWGEYTRVYVFKRSSVQTVPHPIFENVSVQCEHTCFASTTCLYEWWECVRVSLLKVSSVQTVLHPNFENMSVQCDNKCFASITCVVWVRRVWQSICFNM